MTDAASFIMLLWLVAETNFFFCRKAKTAADFSNTPEQEKERRAAALALQKAEALYLRLERKWKKLQPSIARAGRNKDGSFDKRSKLGKMLSRELPRLEQERGAARKEKRHAESRLLRYEKVPIRRRNRWIRAQSFRGACRHSLPLLPALLGVVEMVRTGAPQEQPGLLLLLLWTCIAGCLSLGYIVVTKKKLEA
ncbi:hypothetical protein N8077_03910 [Myxococcota bacterium]|nr:hypothetical protein [Myxococcota bacterium]